MNNSKAGPFVSSNAKGVAVTRTKQQLSRLILGMPPDPQDSPAFSPQPPVLHPPFLQPPTPQPDGDFGNDGVVRAPVDVGQHPSSCDSGSGLGQHSVGQHFLHPHLGRPRVEQADPFSAKQNTNKTRSIIPEIFENFFIL